jgi:hypothetical protein
MGIIDQSDDLFQRGVWATRFFVAVGGEHGRPIGKETAMFTLRKVVLSAALVLTAFALATSAAFAGEALTSNVTAANRRLSDAYRMDGSP